MKLIEALKKIKDLQRKGDDIKKLIKDNCALSNIETPKYSNQGEKVLGWIQAHTDIIAEILRLRIAIQKTNLETMVPIDLGGKPVSKSIAAWIHRRRDLAQQDYQAWNRLTDRNIVEHMAKGPTGDAVEIKITRFFDPSMRDNMKEMFLSEPSIIDGRLEVVNAVTDLIEE